MEKNFEFHQNVVDLERKIVHQLFKTSNLKSEEFNETTFFILKLFDNSTPSPKSVLTQVVNYLKNKYQLSDVHIISLKEKVSDIFKMKYSEGGFNRKGI